MGSNRQKTLFETWNKNPGVQGSNVGAMVGRGENSNPQMRGSVAGPGQVAHQYNVGRGRGQSNRRGNRRGGKSTTESYRVTSKNSFTDGTIVIDDDDEICQQALGQFEMSANNLTKGFEDINAATELPGFDENAGSVWIYPTNSKVRDYQFDIVKTALFNNTLVSLPTGLGKTFIAAVVMYNLHRWYPNDLIVFMAPTRPLVTQQLEACHNIVGIHPSQTVELTGQIAPKKRDDLWKSKTVFFLTPQVMTSDLNRGACPVNKVRCIVVDEAHKATGNHAYVQVIAKVAEQQDPLFFRVLALSATPGSDILAVQQLFKNLMISRVEIRSDDSPDILPYTHQKSIETVVVDLSDHITSCLESLKDIFQVYTGKLMKLNILFGRDGTSFTQFQLLKARESFRLHPPSGIPNYQKGYVESDFATCISLAHALELLCSHGLRSCYIFLQGICDKERGYATVSAELRKNVALRTWLNEIQEKLNISPENSTLNLSTSALFTTFSSHDASSHYVPEEGKETDYTLSHPKMGALKSIVLKHFESFALKSEETRVMIFSQYRDSVQEIGAMLSTLQPRVKPMVFIGQAKSGAGGAGLNQKRQGEVLQNFRTGGYNVLVATCVGEEGLDIGEVDLIICYDTSRSPTRLVQRMGRTGRKRQGKTVFLLTRGKEEKTYISSINMQTNVNNNITDVTRLQPYLYPQSPRMVPVGVDPTCYKMTIVLSSERDDYSANVSKDGNLLKPKKQPKKPSAKGAKSSTIVKAKDFGPLNKDVPGPSSKLNQPLDHLRENENNKENNEPHPNIVGNEMELEFDNFGPDQVCHDTEYNRFLCDFYDINDSCQTFAACLYIPTPPDVSKLIKIETGNSKNISRQNVHNLLLDDFDIRCLREKMDTLTLIGSRTGKCPCGNSNSNFSELESLSPIEVLDDTNDNTTVHKSNLSVGKSPGQRLNKVNSSCHRSVANEKSSNSGQDSNIKDNFEEAADLAFIFGEDDPFFGDDDDWMNEVEEIETKCKSLSVSIENKKVECLNKSKHNTPSSEIVEIDLTPKVVESSVLEQSNAMDVDAGEENNSFQNKEVRYTRTQLHELFKDDEILFEEEGDYTDSDDASTTSNDDFGTPVRGKPGENGEVQIILPNCFGNKTNIAAAATHEHVSAGDASTTGSEEMFGAPNLRAQQYQADLNSSEFEAKPSMQSTPKKVENGNTFDEESFFNDIDVADSEMFHSSPDLSQYRLQNRIKRAKLENDSMFNAYASMTAPENDSADLLNRYVEEMRLKNSNSENRVESQRIFGNASYKKADEFTVNDLLPDSPLEKSKKSTLLNTSGDDNKPIRKFIFKKRSSEGIPSKTVSNSTSPPVIQLTPVSKPYNTSNMNSGIDAPKPCFAQPANLNAVSYNTTPAAASNSSKVQKIFNFQPPPTHSRKLGGLSRNKRNNALADNKTNICDNKNVNTRNINKKEEPTNEIDSIMNSVREYQKQYCSEGFGDHDFVDDDDFVWKRAEEPQRPAVIEERKSIKEIIEEKRLKALQIRNNKRQAEEQHKLKEIQAVTFKIPKVSPVKPFNVKKTLALEQSTPKNFSPIKRTSKHNQENLVVSSAKKVEPSFEIRYRKPPSPTLTGFSDDDDFEFVKPVQRKEQRPVITSPAANINNKSCDEIVIDDESPEPQRQYYKSKPKRPRNPFLEYEAEVSGDSSDGNFDDDGEELDAFDDSFVTQRFEDSLTFTQQARYVESVKDVLPKPCGRVESPKPFDHMLNDGYGEEYEGDSFCVPNDEVEFSDVGAFTQAMQKAKVDLEQDDEFGSKKRITRNGRRLKNRTGGESNGTKRRRRVFTMSDSSDED